MYVADVCVYDGRMYKQGQKWQDGCDYDCICTDGMTGKYECTERCVCFQLLSPFSVMGEPEFHKLCLQAVSHSSRSTDKQLCNIDIFLLFFE